MKTEWFRTIIAINISKKKAVTYSYIDMELLEFMLSADKI
jgi:hypothetical protein